MATIAPEVEDYLAAVEPAPWRQALQALRSVIRSEAPEAEEIISYGQPTFKQDGHLVAYAAFKRHLSFFPMSSKVIADHAEALAGFKTSKGTIQFTPDRPIDEAVVRAMVRFRLAENAAVVAARKAKPRR